MKILRIYFLILFSLFLQRSVCAQQQLIDSLQKFVSTPGADTNKALAFSKLSIKFRNKGDYDKAIEYANSAMKEAKELGFKRGMSGAYGNLGEIYREKGDYSAALENHTHSLEISQELGNKHDIGISYTNIGNIYAAQSDYNKALELYLKASKISEESGDKKSEAINLVDMGMIYGATKAYDKALENYFAAEKIFEDIGEKRMTGMALNNIGFTKELKLDYDGASEYYARSMKIKEEIGDKKGIATAYANMGNVNMEKGNLNEALIDDVKSLKIQQEIGDKNGMANSHLDIGNLYIKMGSLDLSQKHLDTALSMCKEIGDKDRIVESYLGLSHLHEKMQDYEKAYEYHNLYSNLKDSILNESNSKQLAEMNAKYETEKKDKELIKKDAELTLQEADSQQKAKQRNFFIAGFVLILLIAFYIFRGYKQKQKINVAISHQKEIIEQKNKDITDSINYAKRIQQALLASESLLKKNLPEYFIYYQPKDIVSGDFYWALSVGDQFLIAAADCTGHGVPGAFMSLLNISKLNETVNERKIVRPDLILNQVRNEIVHSLNMDETEEQTTKDGMDCVLSSFDFKNMKLRFACANNPLWLVRDKICTEYKPDKMPVGVHTGEIHDFTDQSADLKKGDVIYMFTDGYADQFGGPQGKKFKYSQLKEMLMASHQLPMELQKTIIGEKLKGWRGNLEQVDDILIIGIRV